MHNGVRGSVVYSDFPHVHVDDMCVQVGGGAEKAGAQRALVVFLAVDFDDVPAYARAGPKRSVAETTLEVSALLVHRAHMLRQSARLPERSVALRARVVFALLVHRAHNAPSDGPLSRTQRRTADTHGPCTARAPCAHASSECTPP